jgi:hypothetical protein
MACIPGLSLTACSSESLDLPTGDFNKRWELARASAACNAEIETKRWGTVSAMLTYEQREPDHGFAKCMSTKLD